MYYLVLLTYSDVEWTTLKSLTSEANNNDNLATMECYAESLDPDIYSHVSTQK